MNIKLQTSMLCNNKDEAIKFINSGVLAYKGKLSIKKREGLANELNKGLSSLYEIDIYYDKIVKVQIDGQKVTISFLVSRTNRKIWFDIEEEECEKFFINIDEHIIPKIIIETLTY